MNCKKKSKFLIFFLCAVLILESISTPSFAFERKDHDKYMISVLFKNFLEVDNKPEIKDEIEALECASYLCVDQFNGNGQKDLDYLNAYGVRELPALSEIDFNASGTTHRSYTHRGWNFVYGGLANERWNVRKQLLMNTAGAIFDFQGNERQQESFCALIYYIHILGDYEDDTSWKVSNGLKMAAGGRRDKEDVIDELLIHLKILFDDQQHTHKYLHLTMGLEKYNSKLAKIERSEGGINTDEEFELRQEYVKGLRNLLTLYLPEMLKEEEFFNKAFYK